MRRKEDGEKELDDGEVEVPTVLTADAQLGDERVHTNRLRDQIDLQAYLFIDDKVSLI